MSFMKRSWKSVLSVIALLDMDSFEVQVYQRDPRYAHTKGKPTIVVINTGRYVFIYLN